MKKSNEQLALSDCSKYLASVGVDETVRVWQNHNGQLLHELQPPKQLTTPISALLFASKEFCDDNKSNKGDSVLTLGTVDGRLILYDWLYKKIIKQIQISGQTNAEITSLGWENSKTLSVLTSEAILYFWNTETNEFEQKMKVRGNQKMCKLDDGQYAVASQSIEIIARKAGNTPILKFTGHSSPISVLYPIKSDHGYFLISASSNDTFVYMWNTASNPMSSNNEGVKNSLKGSSGLITKPHISLKVGEGVSSVSSSNKIITSITVSGKLHIFYVNYHRGSAVGAVLPSASLTIFSSEAMNSINPIVKVLEITDSDILIAYGIGSALQFEAISLNNLMGDSKLVRSNKITTGGVSRNLPFITTKIRSKKITYGNPVNMPTVVSTPSGIHGKRKGGEDEPEVRVPMDSLLAKLDKNSSDVGANIPSFSDKCQTHLLLQGLHSDNHKMMSKVLSSSNTEVIKSTLARLPVTAVFPLMQYMHKNCLPVAHTKKSYNQWMSQLVVQHNTYISSLPQSSEIVKAYIKYGQMKFVSYSNLMKLKVQLDMLKSQISRTNVLSKKSVKSYQPLCVMNGDSESEDENMDSDEHVNGFNGVDDLEISDEERTGDIEDDDSSDEESVDDDGDSSSNDEDLKANKIEIVDDKYQSSSDESDVEENEVEMSDSD